MWFLYAILGAFFNALWTSMTKKRSGEISALNFTIMFRLITGAILLPLVILRWGEFDWSYKLFFFAITYALIEGIRTTVIVKGARLDYYSTYAIVNTSPIITLIFSPLLIKSETITLGILFGTVMIITGGFLFYKLGKVNIWSVMAAFLSGIGSIVAKLGTEEANGINFAVLSFIFLVGIFSLGEYILYKKNIIKVIKTNIKSVVKPAFFSAIATGFYFTALESGGVTKVAPVMRFNLIFGFVISYFFLREKSNIKMRIFGGLFILCGGILVVI